MNAKIVFGIAISLLMLSGVFMTPWQATNTTNRITVQNTQNLTPYPSVYYGPRANAIYITPYVDPNHEYLDLQAGAIDAMEWPLIATQYSSLKTSYQYNVNQSSDLGMVNVVLDNGRFPSNIQSYRIAIGMMIDRATLVATTLSGLGDVMPDQLTPAWPIAMHNNTAGFSAATAFPYDPTGAAVVTELTSHGWVHQGSGWNYTGGLGTSNHNKVINLGNTDFFVREDDPNRNAIGTLVSTYAGAHKSQHLDQLITVVPVVSHIATIVAYEAPVCPGGGYTSNACSGSFPAFTAYTQGLSFTIPDPFFFYTSFTTDPAFFDQIFFNFGHWNDTTLNAYVTSLANSPNPDATRDKWAAWSNGLVDKLGYWLPIYYQKDSNGVSDRLGGLVGGDITGGPYLPNGLFFFNNIQSYDLAHLKGVTYGGSIRVGDYDLPNQFNPQNPASNWVFDAQIFNEIYGSLMNYDYGTSALIPGIAANMSITTLPMGTPLVPPIADAFTGAVNGCWSVSNTAPYWTEAAFGSGGSHGCNSTAPLPSAGLRVNFVLNPNAKFSDGSRVTANDVIWNIVSEATDFGNLLESPYSVLSDVNVTSGCDIGTTCLSLWFYQASYEWPVSAALNAIMPALPWIRAQSAQHGTPWGAGNGVMSDVSVTTKAGLNLTAAGGLSLVDSSGPYMFDSAYCNSVSTCDPFGASGGGTPNTFRLVPNSGWPYLDPAKANYKTGIVIPASSLYLPAKYTGGATIPLAVAIVDGTYTGGLGWDSLKSFTGSLPPYGSISISGDYVPVTAYGSTNEAIQSSVTDAVVTYQILGPFPSTAVVSSGPLTYDSGSHLYKPSSPITAPMTGGAYAFKITATHTGSVSTTYGPTGTETVFTGSGVTTTPAGDPLHTAFLVGGVPVAPLPILFATIVGLAIIPAIRRARRVQI